MRFDVNHAIEQLVADYEPGTLNQRAILLFQLQTWVYEPTSSMPIYAGAVAATRFLEIYGRKHFSQKEPWRNSSRQLKLCLEDPLYCQIYDSFLKPLGGWTTLLRPPSLNDLGLKIARRRQESDIVCEIIDYRFRYLRREGADRGAGNITHGQFYCWKGDRIEDGRSKDSPSGKTIRNRWGPMRRSAEFVYISERHGGDLFPKPVAKKEHYHDLQLRVKDVTSIRRVLGKCAYVLETLNGSKSQLDVKIPASVRRIAPVTKPLSDREIQRMNFYGSEYQQMKDS